ncbi:hypothetical protein AB0M45_09225 [Nocardia sp. NPDC051787]|uniref:hypothetical protein n=1 Tax=Nocardia sp. NPDC051787 TaxID=3155415 RepID=UPI003429A385
MVWLNADLIQAVGVAIATVIGAVTARQASEVRKLRTRVTDLERQTGTDQHRLRDALRLIRSLMRHSDEVTTQLRHNVPGVEPPDFPAIPAWLEDEL